MLNFQHYEHFGIVLVVARALVVTYHAMSDGFYRSKDPTNSIKVLKEILQKTKKVEGMTVSVPSAFHVCCLYSTCSKRETQQRRHRCERNRTSEVKCTGSDENGEGMGGGGLQWHGCR